MPNLVESLQGRDLGFLRIVAELWGIEFTAPDTRVGLRLLERSLLDDALLNEVLDTLPHLSRQALDDLLENEGKLSWAVFTRRYGLVREMGPARRDRERPFENTKASPAEALWYRALIGRAFFEGKTGPEEFAFIPDDLVVMLPSPSVNRKSPLGRPASPAERAFVVPVDDRILDDACTLLAGLRVGISEARIGEFFLSREKSPPFPPSVGALKGLLMSAGLLGEDGKPLPDQTRIFLESNRAEALVSLMRAWLSSISFNELHLLPGLVLEGDWQNDPLSTRHAILDFLSTIPGSHGKKSDEERPFWSLAAFIAAIRDRHPDFQRTSGDYDSWYLRDLNGGDFLRGFENWERVEGALIRYMIAGPLNWLGVVDLAYPTPIGEDQAPVVTAFAFSTWAGDLLDHRPPGEFPEESEGVLLSSDGKVRLSVRTPRAVRYQIARFCDWENSVKGTYQYRLTPGSLESARLQGLQVHQLEALLRKYSRNFPPTVGKALENWQQNGCQAFIEPVMVLRLNNPEVLVALRNSRASRYLGDVLGPAAVIVKPGAQDKILAALAEMGFLGELRK